jgi:hypothetical protein
MLNYSEQKIAPPLTNGETSKMQLYNTIDSSWQNENIGLSNTLAITNGTNGAISHRSRGTIDIESQGGLPTVKESFFKKRSGQH